MVTKNLDIDYQRIELEKVLEEEKVKNENLSKELCEMYLKFTNKDTILVK